uniref:Uncharacterized protein n=1 Tax=Tarenaya spinosa TaxID=228870 RepID=Q1KUS9_9ROSI|nr:hypothetical protein [Tarenaya spinosa]
MEEDPTAVVITREKGSTAAKVFLNGVTRTKGLDPWITCCMHDLKYNQLKQPRDFLYITFTGFRGIEQLCPSRLQHSFKWRKNHGSRKEASLIILAWAETLAQVPNLHFHFMTRTCRFPIDVKISNQGCFFFLLSAKPCLSTAGSDERFDFTRLTGLVNGDPNGRCLIPAAIGFLDLFTGLIWIESLGLFSTEQRPAMVEKCPPTLERIAYESF